MVQSGRDKSAKTRAVCRAGGESADPAVVAAVSDVDGLGDGRGALFNGVGLLRRRWFRRVGALLLSRRVLFHDRRARTRLRLGLNRGESCWCHAGRGRGRRVVTGVLVFVCITFCGFRERFFELNEALACEQVFGDGEQVCLSSEDRLQSASRQRIDRTVMRGTRPTRG